MVAKDENKELDVLFPCKEVDLGHGVKVNVRPISLEDLPHVLDSLTVLFQLSLEQQSPTSIALTGAKEVLKLIPYCVPDIKPKNIPASGIPALIEAIIDLNVTDEAVSKLRSLVARAGEKLGVSAQGKSVEPSPKQ